MTPALAIHPSLKPKKATTSGLWIGVSILMTWAVILVVALRTGIDWVSPVTYLLFFALTHLYTGLFITAHDAMHGLVHPDKVVNRVIGTICALLFSYNWYPTLLAGHIRHHSHPASEQDPDYHRGRPSFWAWYLSFARQYVTWWQILAMAVTYNLAKLVVPAESLIVYWMAPAVLSTFQLFYFGTYRPHMGEHEGADLHRARSQRPNHIMAFVTCYFFGYHQEHHSLPWLPWYRLPQARELNK